MELTLKKGSLLFLMLILILFFISCPNPVSEPDPDNDGDGLTNSVEEQYDTNIYVEDSDGDGLTDKEEIVTYGFDASNNNYKYNPLIADLPRIQIRFAGPPDITLNGTTTSSETVSLATNHGSSTTDTSSQTRSNSSSASTIIEQSHSVGASVTTGASYSLTDGFGASVDATVSYDYSTTTTEEETFSWSESQTAENSNTYSEAITKESSETNSVTWTGGRVSIPITVENIGDRSFEVTDITLHLALGGTIQGTLMKAIDNLTYSNGAFPTFSLAKGEKWENVVFAADGINVDLTKRLLQDSSDLVLGVSGYELVDINGDGFSFIKETVNTNTAAVMIDYLQSSSNTNEKHLTSVRAGGGTTITLKKALAEILKIPYQENSSGEVTSVRGDAQNPNDFKLWTIMHKTVDSAGQDTYRIYSPKNGYDINEITLKSGDACHIVLSYDQDQDGVGRRMELMAGSDDTTSNTDNDGLTDYEEIIEGWTVDVSTVHGNRTYDVNSDPSTGDYDGDGLSDEEERTYGTDPNNSDTDRDGLSDFIEVQDSSTTSPLIADMDNDGLKDGEDEYPNIGAIYVKQSETNKVKVSLGGSTYYNDSYSGSHYDSNTYDAYYDVFMNKQGTDGSTMTEWGGEGIITRVYEDYGVYQNYGYIDFYDPKYLPVSGSRYLLLTPGQDLSFVLGEIWSEENGSKYEKHYSGGLTEIVTYEDLASLLELSDPRVRTKSITASADGGVAIGMDYTITWTIKYGTSMWW